MSPMDAEERKQLRELGEAMAAIKVRQESTIEKVDDVEGECKAFRQEVRDRWDKDQKDRERRDRRDRDELEARKSSSKAVVIAAIGASAAVLASIIAAAAAILTGGG